MDNASIKDNSMYKLGVNLGFFAALLLFVSIFYFILSSTNKMPFNIKYSYVIMAVILVYLIALIAKNLRK